MQIEVEAFFGGAPGARYASQVEAGKRFNVAREAPGAGRDDYACEIGLQDATTFTLSCDVRMTRSKDGQPRTDRQAPRVYSQLGHEASFFISDLENKPVAGLKVLVRKPQ